jgi:apolipoprotein N-acyltransferase
VTEGSRSETILENVALALLSGILLAVPFLVPALWWLHYGALIPWIILITGEARRVTWLYVLGGAYAFLFMAYGPLSIFHKLVPFAVAAAYAPFLIPFAIVLRLVYRQLRLPLTLLVPVVWVSTEWLRLHFSLGEVGLFPLGTSQFNRTTLIQVADVTGVYGVSFIVAGANGMLVDVWRLIRKQHHAYTVAAFACYGALVLAVLAYGRARAEPGALRFVPGPRIAIVQPNVIHYRDPRRAFETYEQQANFTRATVAPHSADMIAWPENAVGLPLTDDPRYLQGLRQLAQEKGTYLLLGAYSWADSAHLHTSAFFISPQGTVVGRYDKIHLIPWSEYMPFRGWPRRLGAALGRALLGYTSVGVPGTEVVRFGIRGDSLAGAALRQFAVPICFEVSSSGFARIAAAHGADFLVNITSEGLIGAPLYVHMLAHSTFRAVENRIAVVRVANNGLSGFVDPVGRPHLIPGQGGGGRWLFREAGMRVARVPVTIKSAPTFYTRHGDWLAYCCIGLTLLLLGFAAARMRASAVSAAGTDKRP